MLSSMSNIKGITFNPDNKEPLCIYTTSDGETIVTQRSGPFVQNASTNIKLIVLLGKTKIVFWNFDLSKL